MKKQRQEIRVEQVTPEEQDTLLATQEKQNKIFALVLAGLVLFFFVLIPSHPPVVLFILFAAYAFSGYIIKLWRFGRSKKNPDGSNR